MRLPAISFNVPALRQSRWYEYVLRFAFGGVITVLAGLIAKRYGPELGGLFLAFPAIFPASATLIEKHEKEKKREAGIDGTRRGREAAGLDAAGAALGSLGLIAFAAVAYFFFPVTPAWATLLIATCAWLLIAASLWLLRKTKAGLRRSPRPHKVRLTQQPNKKMSPR